MSKKQLDNYTAGEQRAENEIDTFLKKANGVQSSDILQELKQISLT